MFNKDDSFFVAAIKTHTFILTAQYWEDYENMVLELHTLEPLPAYLSEIISLDSNEVNSNIEQSIRDISVSFFKVLQADWTIGVTSILNVLATLDKCSLNQVEKFIELSISKKMRENEGVKKAINLISIGSNQ